MKPPSPPEETLRRVVRMSRLNGWSVAICGGLSALVSLGLLSPVGVAVSLLVALGGALEVHGQRLLERRAADGLRWLVRGQIVVLAVIWAYAVWQLFSFNRELAPWLASPDLRAMLDGLGLRAEEVLPLARQLYYVLYGALMAATLIYQGGLALYYRQRAAAVEAALAAPPAARAASAPPPVLSDTPPRAAAGDDFAI